MRVRLLGFVVSAQQRHKPLDTAAVLAKGWGKTFLQQLQALGVERLLIHIAKHMPERAKLVDSLGEISAEYGGPHFFYLECHPVQKILVPCIGTKTVFEVFGDAKERVSVSSPFIEHTPLWLNTLANVWIELVQIDDIDRQVLTQQPRRGTQPCGTSLVKLPQRGKIVHAQSIDLALARVKRTPAVA